MGDHSYIKLFRKMLTWGWYGDTNTVRVFLHILLRANYQPSEYKGHKLQPGDCIFGRKAWAKELGLSEREIRTALEHLKSTNEVTTKATNRFTVIHVEKWEFWQIEEGLASNEATNKSPTSDQQATTSKEYKNTSSSTTTNNKGRPKDVDEVRSYVTEKGLVIDPNYFFDYYEENDWTDVKGKPVKSWKLKAQTWSKREIKKNGDKDGNGFERDGETPRTETAGHRGNESHRNVGNQSWFIPEMETTS